MLRIHAAPASKFTQGRRMDEGLHRMTIKSAARSARSIESSQASPAAMLSSSDDTKTSSRPRKSLLKAALRAFAVADSSAM